MDGRTGRAGYLGVVILDRRSARSGEAGFPPARVHSDGGDAIAA
jgi:hypothetical protein